MSKAKSLKTPIIFFVVLALVTTTAYILKRQNQPSQTVDNSSQPTSQKSAVTTTNQKTIVDAKDFSYPLIKGWSLLNNQQLTTLGAASGVVSSNVKFTVAIEPSATSPTNADTLKTATTLALNKLENVQIISVTTTEVNSYPAQQYIYSFGSSTDKIQQQLTTILHNKQVYSLLFTTTPAAFAKQTVNFSTVLAGFKFK